MSGVGVTGSSGGISVSNTGSGTLGASSGLAGGSKKVELPHQLSLKVMRLAKPSCVAPAPLVDDEESLDLPSDASLKLAAAFGEIYLGESFACYLTVQNSSQETVSSVVIKAELQTTSKRYMLHNLEASPIVSMPPEGSDDAVLQRVICDEGVHILVCTASYLTASMGRRSFRKFFKFNVSQPFSLSHRQLQCPFIGVGGGGGQPGDVLIETELENNTPAVLCVTSVRLVCNEMLFGLVADDSHPSSSVVYVPPSCCAQFVHRLNPLRAADSGAYPSAQSALGYLELSWSRGWGEAGTILSPPLVYSPPSRDPLEAELVPPIPPMRAGVPVSVRCKIRNTHHYDSHKVRVHLVNGPKSAVVLTGISGVELPPIPPRQHVVIDLKMLPLKPGMHPIGGLVLESGADKYICNNMATVAVEQ